MALIHGDQPLLGRRLLSRRGLAMIQLLLSKFDKEFRSCLWNGSTLKKTLLYCDYQTFAPRPLGLGITSRVASVAQWLEHLS